MTFTFKAAFALGYRTFKSKYGALLGAGVVFLLVSMGAGFLQTFITVPGLGFILYVFLDGPLWAGMALLAVGYVRGESPALKTLFAGFSRYWRLVGISALVMAVVWLLPSALFLMLAVGITTSWSAPGVGTLLAFALPFIGGVLFFGVRLAFAPVLCIDPRRSLGVRDSFITSWKITAPVFRPLLGLLLVAILISIATAVLFVLPFIFIGLPLAVAVMAAAYELIAGGERKDEVEEASVVD